VRRMAGGRGRDNESAKDTPRRFTSFPFLGWEGKAGPRVVHASPTSIVINNFVKGNKRVAMRSLCGYVEDGSQSKVLAPAVSSGARTLQAPAGPGQC